MQIRQLLCATSLVALAATPALAQDATAEGAERLEALFKTYFGSTEGVVSVVPDGGSYTLTMDFNPLVALIPDDSVVVEISPLTYTLTELGGGQWQLTEDQSFTATASVEGTMDFSLTMDRMVSEGVWDESLAAFATYEGEVTGLQSTTKSYMPDGELISDDSQTIASTTYTSTATAGANGGTDLQVTMDAVDYAQSMQMTLMPGAPPMGFSATADTYVTETTATGMQTMPILDLVAWMVANIPAGTFVDEQDALKERMTEALPLFGNMQAAVTLTNFRMELPAEMIGTPQPAEVLADEMTVAMDMNGLVADGLVDYTIGFDGLGLSEGLIPAWGVPLVPSEMTVNVQVSGFDLAAPSVTFIDAMDLSAPEPIDGMVAGQLLSQLLPNGTVDISMAPSAVTGAEYELTMEGAMEAGPMMPAPVGQARITLTGLEQIQAALADAPPEVGMEMMMPLGMAQSLAQEGPNGELVWEIDASTPGSLKINGMDMMGGMQ